MSRAANCIQTVEMHTGGEPVRIVTVGWPKIPGATILEKRRHARDHMDRLRKLIVFEPRGHHDMYAVVQVEPDLPGADMAVLFLHNEGYSTMCGHAIMALGRFAVDHGIVSPRTPVTRVAIQCPCGMVETEVEVTKTADGYASGDVRFISVPSFAFALDQRVEVPGHGPVMLDIAYGGAFYAILPAHRLGLDLRRAELRELVDAADLVTRATAAAVPLDHPDDPDLGFLYGTILTDDAKGTREAPSRNLCVFARREVDRSPTGSGVSARVALAVARGEQGIGETRWFESVTGAVFSGAPVASCTAGQSDAVRVSVSGRAFYTGTCHFSLEPDDILGTGFLLA